MEERGQEDREGGMTETRCLYDVLEVAQNASEDDLRKAYRRKALTLHPDKNQDSPEATEKFQLLQQAYEVLSDPHERAWYDSHRDQILRGETVDPDAAQSVSQIH